MSVDDLKIARRELHESPVPIARADGFVPGLAVILVARSPLENICSRIRVSFPNTERQAAVFKDDPNSLSLTNRLNAEFLIVSVNPVVRH